MRILGIDPSTSSTGYCVLIDGNVVEHGKLKGEADNPVDFYNLFSLVENLLTKYEIQEVACETQFSGPNANTLIKLTRPTGAILAACGKYGISKEQFLFYYPTSWRKWYHGPGKWSKRDTFKKVKEETGLVQVFTKDNDVSDAIGLAFGHWHKQIRAKEVEC